MSELSSLLLGLETALVPEKVLVWLEGKRQGVKTTKAILGGTTIPYHMEPHHEYFSPVALYLNEVMETPQYAYRNHLHQSLSRCICIKQVKYGLIEAGWPVYHRYVPADWVNVFSHNCGSYHTSHWWDAPDPLSVDQAINALIITLPEDAWLDSIAKVV